MTRIDVQDERMGSRLNGDFTAHHALVWRAGVFVHARNLERVRVGLTGIDISRIQRFCSFGYRYVLWIGDFFGIGRHRVRGSARFIAFIDPLDRLTHVNRESIRNKFQLVGHSHDDDGLPLLRNQGGGTRGQEQHRGDPQEPSAPG